MITKVNRLKLAFAGFCVLLGTTAAQAADLVSTQTTTIFACGKLFDIQANAAGLTAAERSAIVQKNLDNALVAAKDRSPSCVKVVMMNRNPVVTLDGFYVITADGNSAARAQMSQMQLAEKWADSIRLCLADKAAVASYLAMLTGNFKTKTTTVSSALGKREDIAIAPREMTLPVQLLSPLQGVVAKPGDRVEAVLRSDVPFGPDFATYLPAGTRAIGELVYAKNYVPNNYGGKKALTPWFYSLRTADGKDIPIDAYLIGDINLWKNVRTKPSQAICSELTPGAKESLLEANLPLEPVPGEVIGAWRGRAIVPSNSLGFVGEPGYRTSNLQYNGLILPRNSFRMVPAGSPMLLQLAGTAEFAVSCAGHTM
ncbi:MAG: hypothetical protein C5B53_06820 [Candidatus Melainabacteria bacterium]|nr:MAG: hypothetical protein C5B53_06820 [Candidatus Melainabacteria bacterium]